jgi:Transposase zinc-binding domain
VERPKIELADIIRRHGDAYRGQHEASLSSTQRRVMHAIAACRTAALGGHVEACDDCGHQLISYNSCLMESVPLRGARTSQTTPDRGV